MKGKQKKHIGEKPQGERHTPVSLFASIGRRMAWIGGVLFALFAGFLLVGMNSDYLFTVQERSLFTATETFFNEIIATPGGVVRWMGCFLTQFFYYPALGASLLILLWVLTYAVTLKAFRLRGCRSVWALVPLFALLCSVIDLGYWVYYLKIPGYWFAESLSLLLAVLGVWGCRVARGYGRYICLVALVAVGYPLMGWWALLAAVSAALQCAFASGGEKSHRLYLLLGTALLVGIVPLIGYYGYTQMRLDDAWTFGFPMFQINKYTSWLTSVPFFVVAALLLLLPFLSNREKGEKPVSALSVCASLLALVVCGGVTWIANFDDHNYHAEMRMYRHTAEGRWDKVLAEMADSQEAPTRQMVMLKHIALMNTGRLGAEMFRYDNRGKLPHKRDGLTIHMMQTAGPMLYYQFGKLNFATRWCIENGVETGFTPDGLKILARCALLNGEREVALKYTGLLKKTLFHRADAERIEEQIRQPELVKSAVEYKCVRELHAHFDNTLDSDAGFCEMYLLHHFSRTMNIDSKLLQEVTLNFALISKDIQLFWPRFFQYATLHAGETMPIHYQEAAYLYGNLERGVNIGQMPFDKKLVKDRYIQFNSAVQYHFKQGMNEQQVAEATHSRFGDTFWWFYFFCNGVDSY